MKAVLGGKVIALSAFIKKLVSSHSIKLIAHLKTLEQKEANTPKRIDGRKYSNSDLKSIN